MRILKKLFPATILLSAVIANGATPAALTGSDNPGYSFGSSVALGQNFAAVTGAGAVYVFVKPASGWVSMTQRAKLTASDGAYLSSVAISGNTIVAGAIASEEAFVFVEPATGWANTTETAKLRASDGFSGNYFGGAVSIYQGTIVVGAPQTNSVGAPPPGLAGAVYVFVEPAGGWVSTTETAKLVASDGASGDGLGISVAVGGSTVVAGAPNASIGGNKFQGAAYIFVKRGAHWVGEAETAKLTIPYIPFSTLGFSVSISNHVVVASGNQIAFVYVQPSSGWTTTSTPTAQLTETQSHTYFGESISIRNDVVAVGAAGNSQGIVSEAEIYVKPSTGWTNMSQTLSLHSPKDGGHGSFGWSVGVWANNVIVGYPQLFGSGNFGEVAYVFPVP